MLQQTNSPLEGHREADFRAGVIARRFSALCGLSQGELDLLRKIGRARYATHGPRSMVSALGMRRPAPHYIISGWAAHTREFEDGRRQILHLLLPGDSLSAQLCVPRRQHRIQSLSSLQTVDGEEIWTAACDAHAHPGLSKASALAEAQERAFLFNHIARLGRQNAYERMAHLFLELRFRCAQVGMDQEESIPFPLTQEVLADLLGLSGVHVNRTIQLLRREKTIRLKHRRLYFLNVEALMRASEFDPPKMTHLI